MIRGQNTIGYGKTMEAVLKGHQLGLDGVQIADKYGITYAAVRGAGYRLGITLKRRNDRAVYGSVKEMVLREADAGLTVSELARKHGVARSSVSSASRAMGIKLRNGVKGRPRK